MPALEKKWLINDITGLKIHKTERLFLREYPDEANGSLRIMAVRAAM